MFSRTFFFCYILYLKKKENEKLTHNGNLFILLSCLGKTVKSMLPIISVASNDLKPVRTNLVFEFFFSDVFIFHLKFQTFLKCGFLYSNSRFEDFWLARTKAPLLRKEGLGVVFPWLSNLLGKTSTTPPYRASPPSQGGELFVIPRFIIFQTENCW